MERGNFHTVLLSPSPFMERGPGGEVKIDLAKESEVVLNKEIYEK